MNPYDLLGYLLLGSFLGAVGQGIRIIVGIKKRFDEVVPGKSLSNLLDGKRMGISVGIALVVGAIAGALGVLDFVGTPMTKETVTTLISIGYAGTDFIEGFMRRTQTPIS